MTTLHVSPEVPKELEYEEMIRYYRSAGYNEWRKLAKEDQMNLLMALIIYQYQLISKFELNNSKKIIDCLIEIYQNHILIINNDLEAGIF